MEKTKFRPLKALFTSIFVSIPAEFRSNFRSVKLDSNVSRMFVLSIYLICVQIALNIVNIVKPSDQDGDILLYIILSLVLLLMGIVYCILLSLVRKRKITNKKVKWFLTESLLYGYFIIQLIFCTLNIFSTGGVNSYVIAILIVGLVPVISPLKSIITIGSAFAYLFIVMYSARNISDAWDSIMISDTWASLIIITGIVLCVSIIMYKMFVSSFLQRMYLRNSNKELLAVNSELSTMNDRLESIANTDKMTGVLNRRAFSRDFDDIWRFYAHARKKIAIAIADIDFFKQFNDQFGHLAGDACLQKVAASLQNSFRRSTDFVYRYGGEEFLIVFDANSEDAYGMAEQARKNVEALHIQHAVDTVSPYVTISIGVCVVEPRTSVPADDALKIADDALYASKNSGRNQTTLKAFE